MNVHISVSRILLSIAMLIAVIIWAVSGFPLPEFAQNIYGFCCFAIVIVVVVVIIFIFTIPADVTSSKEAEKHE